MFDVFEDIYYDMLNDMSDDIWWYLKIADIFDDIFDRWWCLIFFKIIAHIIYVSISALWEVMVYIFGLNKSSSFLKKDDIMMLNLFFIGFIGIIKRKL